MFLESHPLLQGEMTQISNILLQWFGSKDKHLICGEAKIWHKDAIFPLTHW